MVDTPNAQPILRAIATLLAILLSISSYYGADSSANDRKLVSNSTIHVLTIDGVITPLTARYLDRSLGKATKSDARFVILRLDTPGGLESSMRTMTKAMLGSSIPVIVFVGPSGARAASAGMFLTMAAHVATMAPGTNIGAAHPVSLGKESSAKPDDAAAAKVTNDAAALARAIAVERGRNSKWAELAVRDSVSVTSEEALSLGIIDLLAQDRTDLLRQLHGRRVRLMGAETTLTTTGATIVETPMSLVERVVQAITDPNIAYLLMSIGFIGIIASLYNPGAIFPGVVGLISLLVAFSALGSLPLSWAGLVLLALGIILLVIEVQTEGIGVLAPLGLLGFVLGSLFLYRPLSPPSPSMPAVEVNRWLIAGTALVIIAFFLVVLRALIRVRRQPVTGITQVLVGQLGTVESDLAPKGQVNLNGERWTAIADDPCDKGKIHTGDRVRVTAVDGVTLRVRPQNLPRAMISQT